MRGGFFFVLSDIWGVEVYWGAGITPCVCSAHLFLGGGGCGMVVGRKGKSPRKVGSGCSPKLKPASCGGLCLYFQSPRLAFKIEMKRGHNENGAWRTHPDFMGPSALQEDVARLKASSGSKTILSIISGAMEQVSFWSGKIQEYLATAPAMRRERKTVSDYHMVLDGLDGSMKDLEGLMKVGSDIARLKACLIPATMANLCAKFCKALKASYSITKDQLAGRVEEGQKMSKILQEASTNFPFDAEIQAMLLECGGLLQKAGETAVVLEVMEALQSYKAFVPEHAEGDKQAAAWQQKAENLRGRLASFALSPSAWRSEQLHAAAKEVLKLNLEQCAAEVSVAPKNSGLLFEIVALMGELADKVGDEAMCDISSSLELLEKITQAYAKVLQVKEHGQLGDEQQVLTNVAGLQRACTASWDAIKKANAMPQELCSKIKEA